MLQPPRHRLDAPGLYVHREDPAIRFDVIEAEEASIAARIAAEGPGDHDRLAAAYRHPWRRYASGDGRFDLDARSPLYTGAKGDDIGTRSARDYLDAGATIFTLRRLDRHQREQVGALISSDRAGTINRLGRPLDDVLHAAWVDDLNRIEGTRLAVVFGLAGIQGWHRTWPAGEVTTEMLDDLYAVGGPGLLHGLAMAIITHGEPLRRTEGLPSASPGTEPSR